MSDDPRAALAVFVNALERHLELASSGRDSDDPHLREAFDALSDAFEAYDDALYDEYGVATPFFVPADEDDDDFDDDLDYDDEDDEDDEDDDEDDEEDVDDRRDEEDDLDDELDDFDEDEDDHHTYHGLEDEDIEYEDK